MSSTQKEIISFHLNFYPSPYRFSAFAKIIYIDPLERSYDLHAVNTIDCKIKEFIRREEDLDKSAVVFPVLMHIKKSSQFNKT